MKFRYLLPMLFGCLLLSGCWDKTEIENRSFISTIGIDPGKDIDKLKDLMKTNIDDPFQQRQVKLLNVTFGFPDISQLSPQKAGSPEDKSLFVESYSMEDSINRATAKSSRSLFLGDSKLLLLSDNFLKYPEIVKQVLDYFERQPKTDASMYVVVCDGSTEDYIKFKPAMEKNMESYISGIMENSLKTSTVLPVTLNELLILLNENGNAVVPRLTLDKNKNEICLNGVGVIKNFTIKGYLTPLETSDLEILRGKVRSGNKVIYKDGNPIDFVIEGIDRKIEILNKDSDDKLKANINIRLEGEIRSYTLGGKLLSKEEIEEFEQAFNKSLSIECTKVASILQTDFVVDAIGIREHVEKYRPKYWNKIKDNWDENYKNSLINVNVQVKIRRIGVAQ